VRAFRLATILVLSSALLVMTLVLFGRDRELRDRGETGAVGYQASQARVPIGSGERPALDPADDPLQTGAQRAQSPLDRRRAGRVLAFLRETDPANDLRVRRVVITTDATWVFSDVGTDEFDQASLVAACTALVGHFAWSDAVATIGNRQTPTALTSVLVEGGTRSDCAVTRVQQSR
jgi:hypothetical protein